MAAPAFPLYPPSYRDTYERRTFVASIVPSDPDGDQLTNSIVLPANGGAADGGLFTWDASGTLSFLTSPDYEVPTDSDGDNFYEVTLRASDGTTAVDSRVSIKVNDVAMFSGTNGPDNLTADNGADTIYAGGGDDLITGGEGNDGIHGDAGFDTVNFSGLRSEYYVVVLNRYDARVIHQGGSGTDGTDRIFDIEALSFADGTFSYPGGNWSPGVQLNRTSNIDGGRFDDILLQDSVTGAIYTKGAAPGDSTYGVISYGAPAGLRLVGSGDMTFDGRADLLFHDTNTGVFHKLSTASGTPAWQAIGGRANLEFIDTGYISRYNVTDYVVRDTVTNQVLTSNLDDKGNFQLFRPVFNIGADWRPFAVADVTTDGAADILVQQISTGITYYWSVDGHAWGNIASGIGTEWVAKEAIDLTGDGYAEVIFQNAATGDVWYKNSALGDGAGAWGVVGHALSDWEVRAAADTDNDGYGDVILQHQTDGRVYVADMNLGVNAGYIAATDALGSSWLVV